MTHTLFLLTRIIAILLVFSLNSTLSLSNSRALLLVLTLFVFLGVSWVYEKARGVFSVTYIFYFLVCFLSSNYFNYTFYKGNMYNSFNPKSYLLPPDYYSLYASIFLSVSVVFLFFIVKTSKKIKLNFIGSSHKIITGQRVNSKRVFFNFLLVFSPLYFFVPGEAFNFLGIGFFVISVVTFSLYRRERYSVFLIFMAILVFLKIFTSRYLFVQFVFPIVLYFLYKIDFKNVEIRAKFNFKVVLYTFISFISVLIYGVVSELYKLSGKGLQGRAKFDMNLVYSIFAEKELLLMWAERQVFRLFQVWSLLGGNIIYYVKSEGLLWGRSYFGFIEFFGFEYVDIPKLSADMTSSSYAQPGVLANGYANFGFIGAVISFLLIIILMEFTLYKYTKSKSFFSFVLMITPFTKILLDGGTISSSIYTMITLFFLMKVNILKFFKR